MSSRLTAASSHVTNSSTFQNGAYNNQSSATSSVMNTNGDYGGGQSNTTELFNYRKQLLQILSKFSDAHTVKTGMEEIKKFMSIEITDNDRMIVFLNTVGE